MWLSTYSLPATDRLVSCARRRMSLIDHWKAVCDRENAPPISLHRLAVGGIFLVCFRITDMASLGENDKAKFLLDISGTTFARFISSCQMPSGNRGRCQ